MTDNSRIIELQDFRDALKKLAKQGYRVTGIGSKYFFQHRNNYSDAAVLTRKEILQKALAS